MKLSFLPADMNWRCHRCDQPLVAATVELEYLGHNFNVELPVCKGCGEVLVSEELAVGRMAEVERLLEDK